MGHEMEWKEWMKCMNEMHDMKWMKFMNNSWMKWKSDGLSWNEVKEQHEWMQWHGLKRNDMKCNVMRLDEWKTWMNEWKHWNEMKWHEVMWNAMHEMNEWCIDISTRWKSDMDECNDMKWYEWRTLIHEWKQWNEMRRRDMRCNEFNERTHGVRWIDMKGDEISESDEPSNDWHVKCMTFMKFDGMKMNEASE